MNSDRIATKGLLVLPRLRIQNANAISSPLTHGFPSLTAFAGFMWALERKLTAAGIKLGFDAFGVICHSHQEQVGEGYVKTFCLTRNPLDDKGSTSAIIEEGRMHLDLTLVFSTLSTEVEAGWIFTEDREAERRSYCSQIADIVSSMRVAGGSVISSNLKPQLLRIPTDAATREQAFRSWRRRWLPGFTLVSREDLLRDRLNQLQAEKADSTLLDAWLDLSRFNWRSELLPNGKIEWSHDRKGWIVPIPVGYASLASHGPSEVLNARDKDIPFHFVESIHSIGEWLGPHRLTDVDQMLWQPDTQNDSGLYLIDNKYAPSRTSE